ncbi:MAG: hypothetical protein V1816_03830 [Pseudomonadota bacterium]
MPPGLGEEISDLRDQVTANCNRSDARYAGSLSLCGLLLRLREFYKWEQGLPPWAEVDSPVILAWIEAKENSWEPLAEDESKPLLWRGRRIDPFDSALVNRDIIADGLFYGAGLAAFLKPSFFLARVLEERDLDGIRVLRLGEEHARDLFASPAQTLDDIIVARRGPLAAFLWDTLQYGEKSRRKALDLAAWVYGLKSGSPPGAEEWKNRFEAMVERETEPLVRHELGEIRDSVFQKELWRDLIGAHPHSRVELLARAIKDVLADTAEFGRLGFIVKSRRLGSLGVFAAWHDGLAARIFEEFAPAFERFLETKDWDLIDAVREKGWEKAAGLARRLSELAAEGRDRPAWLVEQVQKIFYAPLGL